MCECGKEVANYHASVVVIGAGQAGLSAAYHLQKRGFESAFENPGAPFTYAVFDAAELPGGAWRHRWESLTMATVNNIFDLPNFPKPRADLREPSRSAIPRYFADFEQHFGLAIHRPVRVLEVKFVDSTTPATSDFLLHTTAGIWRANAIINATGTWDNPVIPIYPGSEVFSGQQLHTRDYRHLEDFKGARVAIVGGGISAVQQLEEISRVAQTFWYTRREPVFHEHEFTSEYGHEVVAKVIADVEAGRPTGSVVSYTGLSWSPYAVAARERGALVRRPMFTHLDATGVWEADGTHTAVDAILWATGFKPALQHLEKLGLRGANRANENGANENTTNDKAGITLRGTRVAAYPRIHLIGYGPSQSTVGANRAGRIAASELHRLLRGTVQN